MRTATPWPGSAYGTAGQRIARLDGLLSAGRDNAQLLGAHLVYTAQMDAYDQQILQSRSDHFLTGSLNRFNPVPLLDDGIAIANDFVYKDVLDQPIPQPPVGFNPGDGTSSQNDRYFAAYEYLATQIRTNRLTDQQLQELAHYELVNDDGALIPQPTIYERRQEVLLELARSYGGEVFDTFLTDSRRSEAFGDYVINADGVYIPAESDHFLDEQEPD